MTRNGDKPTADEIRAGIRGAVVAQKTAELALRRWMARAQDCPDITMEEAGELAAVNRTTAHSLARQGKGEAPYHSKPTGPGETGVSP